MKRSVSQLGADLRKRIMEHKIDLSSHGFVPVAVAMGLIPDEGDAVWGVVMLALLAACSFLAWVRAALGRSLATSEQGTATREPAPQPRPP